MWPAFPSSEYYDGSAPPAPSAGNAPIPPGPPWPARTRWNGHEWFPRSLLFGRRVRHPALPLRSRHGYAVDLHHGLPARTSKPARSSPPEPIATAGTHRTPAQIHRVRAGSDMKRRNNTGSSRIPSRLAHRARPIRQCWTDPTLSRLLPPSPAIPGIGCRQLHPAATTARHRRSLTSIRTQQRLVAHHQLLQIADLFRSPACVAVKIRCRSRRTSSSTARQSTASQSTTSPSGPFTSTVSNLPIGSSVSVHLFFTGSPDPRQLPFGPGNTPVSDQLCGIHPAEVPVTRFPVSCRRFGCRPSLLGSSCARWGVAAFLTVGLPASTCRTPTGLSCCT